MLKKNVIASTEEVTDQLQLQQTNCISNVGFVISEIKFVITIVGYNYN